MRKGWALCVTKWFLSSSLRNLTKEFWSSLCLLPGGVILDPSWSRSPKYPAPRPALIPFLSSCPLPRVSPFLAKAFITKNHLIIIARCGPDAGTPFRAGISFNGSPALRERLKANQDWLHGQWVHTREYGGEIILHNGFEEEGEIRIMRTEVSFFLPEIGVGMQGLSPRMMTSKLGSLLVQVTHTALASGLYLIFHC